MDLDTSHPAIGDLKKRARRRIPYFVWEYLESATGDERTQPRNRAALDRVLLRPSILHGEVMPDTSARLMGREYPVPVGIAPMGMSGLVWPDAERTLARVAAETGIPNCLSTVAAQPPEAVADVVGDQGWFQLYPPRDPDILTDILRRARDSGFHTIVLTADVPVASRRERLRRARLSNPPKITLPILVQVARRPAWALGTLRVGMPRLRLMESYRPAGDNLPPTAHVGYLLRVPPDWKYLARLRDAWDGPLVVKGVLDPADASRLRDSGVDAVWVSNHAGRQFDAPPATAAVLPAIRTAVGPDYPLIFDGGVTSGLDVLRAVGLGADFVMAGRAFYYGLAAFGSRGVAHALHILRADIEANMGQMGLSELHEARDRLIG